MSKLAVALLLLACVALASADEHCHRQPEEANSNPCSVVRCGYGATCRVVSGRAKCECPSICPALYAPVCGSDGNTYSNTCQLNVYNCKNKKSVRVEHTGACEDSQSAE